MYKLRVNLKIDRNSIIPGYLTILCGIILITIITDFIYFEYLIPVCSMIFFACGDKGKIKGKEGKKIFMGMLLFAAIQVIGLFGNFTIYSIKNILTTCATFLLIYTLAFGKISVQKYYIKFYYFMACLVCIAMIFIRNSAVEGGNTVAGYFTFYFLMLTAMLADRGSLKGGASSKTRNYKTVIVLGCSILPPVIFSFLYAARTALIVSIFVLMFYFIFYIFNFEEKVYRRLFFVMLFFIVVALIVYIYATSFDWYDSVNALSVKYFGKNIDSSRSFLWRTSLRELRGFHWITGLGTGITPSLARYAGSSFHNSFIQTLMQNGILGLSSLIFVFWILWKNIVKIKERSLRALFMSAFVAVIAYNCMECCLLQNKTFLGMMQWMVLALGVQRSRMEESKKR